MFDKLLGSRALATLLCSMALATLAACEDPTSSPTEPEPDPEPSQSTRLITGVITSLRSGDGSVRAQLQPGAPPASGAGPAVSITVPQNFIQGGSAQIPVTSPTAFSRIVMAVQGLEGYYDLALPAPTTSSSVLVAVDPSAAAGSSILRVAGGTGTSLGAFAEKPVTVLNVGTGDFQISVSWDAPSDVDLHVVAPGGREIYYGNPSDAGGTLDLDSNAGCSIDNKNNENVTWASTPPSGTYVVRLDYFDACRVARTNWVVTVRRGADVQTFTGTFTGSGEQGGEGSGRLITTFTR